MLHVSARHLYCISVLKIKVLVTFAAAILLEPQAPLNQELDEWITVSYRLLRNMGTSNPLAVNATLCLDRVRIRTGIILQPDCNASSPLSHILDVHSFLDRIVPLLNDSPLCLADTIEFGHLDQSLMSHNAQMYSIPFPTMETLSQNVDPQSLDVFIDALCS